MKYVFYDLETTDIDLDFGQILQIGAVVCDEDFNILEEHDLHARLQPWVVPSPSALLLTGLSPADLGEGDSLYEVIRNFEALLREQGEVFATAGYNSMGFDDYGLRAAFHQNLLDIRLTSAENDEGEQNPRIDVLEVVRACVAHRPDLLKLDIVSEKGNKSTKLGVVCRQNGIDLSEDAAHEAVADVKATIAVAKLIKQKDPDLWDQVMTMTTKSGAKATLLSHPAVCYTRTFFGKPNNKYITAVTPEADREDNVICFDLSYDPSKYLNMSAAELAEELGKKKKPFTTVKTNSVPTLFPAKQTDVSHYPKGVSLATMNDRAQMIADHLSFAETLQEASQLAQKTYNVSPFVEKQIYEQTPEDAELLVEQWMFEFHRADWFEKAELIDIFPTLFNHYLDDAPHLLRYNEFAKRIVYDNCPDVLDHETRVAVSTEIGNRLSGKISHKKLISLQDALDEVEKIKADLDEGKPTFISADEMHKLDELTAYYQGLANQYGIDLAKASNDNAVKPSNAVKQNPTAGL